MLGRKARKKKLKCITIIISVYRQAHHYLNPIYVDKIFHNNINQQLSLSRINSTTSLYSFFFSFAVPHTYIFLVFLLALFSCVLHISSLYFDFVISPPIILIAGRWNSSGIHRIEVYTFLFWMSWNWVRRLEKFEIVACICKNISKKKCSQHIFSRIHRYIKFTLDILYMMLRRDLPLMLDYTWSIFFSPSFSKKNFFFSA